MSFFDNDELIQSKRKDNPFFGDIGDKDLPFQDMEFKMPKESMDLKLGFPTENNGVIRKGTKILRDSQRNGRKSKSFGIKSTVIRDGVRVIRKSNKGR